MSNKLRDICVKVLSLVMIFYNNESCIIGLIPDSPAGVILRAMYS